MSYTKKRMTGNVAEDIEDEEGNVTVVKVLWHGEDKPCRKRSDPGLLIVVPIDLDKSQYYSAALGQIGHQAIVITRVHAGVTGIVTERQGKRL